LVDEVLAVGDSVFQQKCRKVFWDYKKAGKTILFVSHDASNIREYCSRAIVINDGQLAFDGFPDDAIRHYNENILRIQVP
jgi:ABC-type polysaccharide/polyol phosphate transport system ATPase subunit